MPHSSTFQDNRGARLRFFLAVCGPLIGPKNKWGGAWGGKAGPTRPIPISTQHLCKFFPVWQRWTYDVVAGARTCTTLVGLSLNFTTKCEYWINLACSYTEILTQVTQVLRVGYLNSNDLMINCIQLALKWRVPLMNLLSVKFFAPWLLFITSNIYISKFYLFYFL